MAPVIRRFVESGCEAHALFGFYGHTLAQAVSETLSPGCSPHFVPLRHAYRSDSVEPKMSRTESTPSVEKNRQTFFSKALSFASNATSTFVRSVRINRWANACLEAISPDVIFSGPYQSLGRMDNAVERFAKTRGIPYHCMLYSFVAGTKVNIEAKYLRVMRGELGEEYFSSGSLFGRIAGLLFPGWWAPCKGRRIFPFPPSSMLGAKLAGLLSSSPWLYPSNGFDQVFVYSDETKRMLVEGGYPSGKIVASGCPGIDDALQKSENPEFRRRLFRDMGLDPGERFILVNIEPAFEHRYASKKDHFNNLRQLMESLQTLPQKKILSLHPLCKVEDYLFLESNYDCRISIKYKLMQLYPFACAVFSMPCSTNILSKYFSKPLVVYNFYDRIDVKTGSGRDFYFFDTPIARDSEELRVIINQMDAARIFGNVQEAPSKDRSSVKAVDCIYDRVLGSASFPHTRRQMRGKRR